MLKLTEFEEKVVEHILQSPAPGKHAGRSALRHLERARRLIDQMPELAVFCGITAEEEAASAVFRALRRRNYDGARLLKVRSHLHKTALHPFLLAVGKLFGDIQGQSHPKLEFNSELSHNGSEQLRISVTVPDGRGDILRAYPLPPLEFTVEVNDVAHTFEPALSKLATEKNASSAFEYVKDLANRRNEVLYAAENDILHVEERPHSFLTYRKSVVFSHLIAFLLIDPYPKRQLFVQQALGAFLRMIKRLPMGSDET